MNHQQFGKTSLPKWMKAQQWLNSERTREHRVLCRQIADGIIDW
jgi:hypothetical protein